MVVVVTGEGAGVRVKVGLAVRRNQEGATKRGKEDEWKR